MEGTHISKKVLRAKFVRSTSVGKPRKRWEDVVQQDVATFLRCRNWKLATNDRKLWSRKIEEVKAQYGL
jgi:hypothetical protein